MEQCYGKISFCWCKKNFEIHVWFYIMYIAKNLWKTSQIFLSAVSEPGRLALTPYIAISHSTRVPFN